MVNVDISHPKTLSTPTIRKVLVIPFSNLDVWGRGYAPTYDKLLCFLLLKKPQISVFLSGVTVFWMKRNPPKCIWNIFVVRVGGDDLNSISRVCLFCKRLTLKLFFLEKDWLAQPVPVYSLLVEQRGSSNKVFTKNATFSKVLSKKALVQPVLVCPY